MKTLSSKLSILILIIGLSVSAIAQTISINSTFTENAEIYPFGSTGTVYGLSINGNIELNSDTS